MQSSSQPSAPSFSNQRSNIHALSSKLAGFSQTIEREARALRTRPLERNPPVESAVAFLAAQRERLTRVEEALLQGTEDILPMDDDKEERMTVTELSNLCQSLQRANVAKMEHLDQILQQAGIYKERPCTEGEWAACSLERAKHVAPAAKADLLAQTPPAWQSVPPLQPLEQVVEIDYETDATTTPGSNLFSPPLSLTPAAVATTPNTPPTPASLHLSVNTASALKQTSRARSGVPTKDDKNGTIRHSLDAIESWREKRKSLLSILSYSSTTVPSQEEPGMKQDVPQAVTGTTGPWSRRNHVPDAPPQGLKAETLLETHDDQGTAPLSRRSHTLDAPQGLIDDDKTESSGNVVKAETLPETHDDQESVTIDECVPKQSITILGLSFADDDTAAADTIATVLAKGRERTRHAQQRLSTTILGDDHTLLEDETVVDVTATVVKKRKDEDKWSSQPNPSLERTQNDPTSVILKKESRDERKVYETIPSPQEITTKASELVTTQDSPDSQHSHSVKEVVVDTSTSSYGRDLDELTLGTELNETLVSPSKPTDKSLTVTPVLDRYRLELGENSDGIKVVPNERGRDRTRRKEKDQVGKYSKGWAVSKNLEVATKSAEATMGANAGNFDSLVSPHVTRRSQKKVFRKTPHPKKTASIPPIDEEENVDPNSMFSFDLSSLGLSSNLQESQTALRSPFGRSSMPSRLQSSSNDEQSLVKRFSLDDVSDSQKHRPVESKAPLTAAFIAKHMPDDTGLIESLTTIQKASTFQHSGKNEKLHRIQSVPLDEYERAPKVVRMQITRDEVNVGIAALNMWLSNCETSGRREIVGDRVKEQVALGVLQKLFTERKSASVLMGLCHWRRIEMRRQDNGATRDIILPAM